MSKSYTRIPLDVKPELAVEIDRTIARLTLKNGERQTRTGFIVRAIRAEIDRVVREELEKHPD